MASFSQPDLEQHESWNRDRNNSREQDVNWLSENALKLGVYVLAETYITLGAQMETIVGLKS